MTTSAAISCTTLTLDSGFTGSLTMSNALTVSGTLTHTQGTLNTNGQTCSWGLYSANNSNTKALTLGASAITVTGGTSAWVLIATGTTLTAGTSAITFNGSSAGFAGGTGLTYYDVSFTGASTVTIDNTITYHNFTRTGTASLSDRINFNSGTITVSNVLTITGNSTINRMLVLSANTVGTARSIICDGSFSFSNVDFRDITASGSAGTWTGTQMGDCLGNSGITFDSSRTIYHVGNGAVNWQSTSAWSTTSGGASGANPPLPQDDAVVDANSFLSAGKSVNLDMPRLGRNLDFTNVANNPTINFLSLPNVMDIYGNLTFGSDMSIGSGTNTTTLLGRGSQTITTAGKSFNCGINISSFGGTYTLQDNFNMAASRTLVLAHGTLATLNNDKNVSVGIFTANAATTKVINMGTGTWTLTGIGTVFNPANAATTLNSSTATIHVTNTSASNKTVAALAGHVLPTLTIVSGTGTVTLSGNYTIGTLNLTAPITIIMLSSQTKTITTAFNAVGSSGNIITIESSVAGTAATLSKTSGVVSADWLSLKDSTATGGAKWYAGANSTNVSGNTGWIFTAPPGGSNLLMMGVG